MSTVADTRPLRRWLAQPALPTDVLVACREHGRIDAWLHPRYGGRTVVYHLEGCLADLPPAALLEILAGGAASVSALLDGCAHPMAACEVVEDAARIAAVVAAHQPVRPLLEPPSGCPAPAATSERSDLPLDHVAPQGRRLRHDRTPAVFDACSILVSRRRLLGGGDPLPPPDQHPGIRLHAAVRELLGDGPVPSALEDVPTGAAQLAAPGCGGAGVCVRACPADALSLTVTDLTAETDSPSKPVSQFDLTIDPGRCIDCGLCVELCPESAMTRVRPLPWAQALEGTPTTLRAGLIRRCSRCQTPYRTEGSLCNVCAFRTSHPFGSQLPEGFVRAPR